MQQLKILFFSLFISSTVFVNAQNEGIQFDLSTQTFPALEYSALDFGDIDGDGDEDFILTGSNGNASNDAETYLYENQGNGFFILVSGTPFERVFEGDVEFADIDNDGDLDLLIVGENNSGDYIAELYENSGNGTFTTIASPFDFNCTQFGYRPRVKFAHLNSDQYIDLVFVSEECQNILLNDGTGFFVATSFEFTPEDVENTDFDLGDLDGDGDMDIVIIMTLQTTPMQTNVSKVFKNNGNTGQFIEESTPILNSYGSGNISLIDIDNDFDLDVLLESGPNSYLYENISTFSNVNFSQVMQIPSFGNGNSVTFDVNDDGHTDKISVGSGYFDSTYVHYNTNGIFDHNDPVQRSSITGEFFFADIDYADIDNDGDMDLLISGRFEDNGSYIESTQLFYNNSCPMTGVGIDRQYIICDTMTWRNGNFFNCGSPIEPMETRYDTIFSSNGCDSIVEFQPVFLCYRTDGVNHMHPDFMPEWIDVANNAASVQWLDCDNNHAPVPGGDHLLFTPPSNGTYAIRMDDGECADTSGCFVVNNVGLAPYLQNNVKIYPNPSSGIFTVETPLSSFQYQVYNTVGQEVLSGQATHSYLQLDLAGYESGVYILNVISEGGEKVNYRFVRE